MVLGLDFLRADDALHDAFFVDDEGGAEGTHVLTAVHALLAPYTKLLDQFLVCVGNQGKGERVLLDELLVRLLAVHTYAYHFVASLAQGVVVIAQVAGLGGTTRCAVFRIEVEHQFLSFIIAQADFFAFLVDAQYLGGFVSYMDRDRILRHSIRPASSRCL